MAAHWVSVAVCWLQFGRLVIRRIAAGLGCFGYWFLGSGLYPWRCTLRPRCLAALADCSRTRSDGRVAAADGAAWGAVAMGHVVSATFGRHSAGQCRSGGQVG